MNAWYADLNRPPLTPPDWLFGPVWTVLYILIALSIALYYRTPKKTHLFRTTLLLTIHLIFNLSWTHLFFILQSPGLALIDIILLDISLLFLVYCFYKSIPLAAYLLLPYLSWVLFATYLNIGFFRLN